MIHIQDLYYKERQQSKYDVLNSLKENKNNKTIWNPSNQHERILEELRGVFFFTTITDPVDNKALRSSTGFVVIVCFCSKSARGSFKMWRVLM